VEKRSETEESLARRVQLDLQTHRARKYSTSALLPSSVGLGWSTISAELRCHEAAKRQCRPSRRRDCPVFLRSARALTQLGGGVAIAPAIAAWNGGVFPRSVNRRSAQPHHDGNRHDRRPIDRGIPDRQIGLRQNFGGWAGPRQTADQPVEGCSGLRRHRLPDLLPLPPSESCRRANSAPTG
jgi:hypothetical protein